METSFVIKLVSVLLFVPVALQATNLTWDANTGGGTHPQDGSGTWDTVTADWWNGTADQTFNIANPDSPTFGAINGVAGTVTLGTSVVTGTSAEKVLFLALANS